MRSFILLTLFALVCLSAGCLGTARTPAAPVVDTRPTAAQAQAQADAGLSRPQLKEAAAKSDQALADAIASNKQVHADLDAANLRFSELIYTLVAVVALFVAGAAEALAIYESALSWLFKPLGYALAGVAITAYCIRLALPYLGLAEAVLLLAILAVGFYSLRKNALAQAIVAKVDALAAKAEAEAKAFLADGEAEVKSLLHLGTVTSAPAPAANAAPAPVPAPIPSAVHAAVHGVAASVPVT